MINIFKNLFTTGSKPEKPTAKVWLIDPVKQKISEIDSLNIPSLVGETLGDDVECFKLDNNNNVVWMTDTDSNPRYAYFWDAMPYPFDVKRYSKALVVSLGPNYWSTETIESYLRFFDRLNAWGDV